MLDKRASLGNGLFRSPRAFSIAHTQKRQSMNSLRHHPLTVPYLSLIVVIALADSDA